MAAFGKKSDDKTEMTAQPRKRGLWLRLRNYFFAGLLVSAPIFVTGWLVVNVIAFFDKVVLAWLPDRWQFESLPFGMGLIVAFFGLVAIGFLTANLVGRMVVGFFEKILARVPVISNIYKTIKQIFDTVLANRSSSFRKVVLIEYPRRDIWALAFVAGDTPKELEGELNDEMVGIFLPTTPNPTSGFFLLVPKRDVIELDMTVEEGVKMVVSSGIVTPEKSKKQLG